jgi:hypothetical protein
MLRRSQ